MATPTPGFRGYYCDRPLFSQFCTQYIKNPRVPLINAETHRQNVHCPFDRTRPRQHRFIYFGFLSFFIYSGIICFVCLVSAEPESSIPEALESAEEDSEGELQGGRGKRGQGGKRDTRRVQMYEESGSVSELNSRLREILHELQEELGVSHHPYSIGRKTI